jgi:hypothetical protein
MSGPSIHSCRRYALMYVAEPLDSLGYPPISPAVPLPCAARRLCRVPLPCLPLETNELSMRLLGAFPAVVEVAVAHEASALLVVCLGAEDVDGWIDAISELLADGPKPLRR